MAEINITSLDGPSVELVRLDPKVESLRKMTRPPRVQNVKPPRLQDAFQQYKKEGRQPK